jgi:hypothetical protein
LALGAGVPGCGGIRPGLPGYAKNSGGSNADPKRGTSPLDSGTIKGGNARLKPIASCKPEEKADVIPSDLEEIERETADLTDKVKESNGRISTKKLQEEAESFAETLRDIAGGGFEEKKAFESFATWVLAGKEQGPARLVAFRHLYQLAMQQDIGVSVKEARSWAKGLAELAKPSEAAAAFVITWDYAQSDLKDFFKDAKQIKEFAEGAARMTEGWALVTAHRKLYRSEIKSRTPTEALELAGRKTCLQIQTVRGLVPPS